MVVGQELTSGLKGVGHVFSYMLKQEKSPTPPPPHINNDQSLTMGKLLGKLCGKLKNLTWQFIVDVQVV